MENNCIYFIYKKYCDRLSKTEEMLYGYADPTERKCEFKDCQNKCEFFKKEEKQK